MNKTALLLPSLIIPLLITPVTHAAEEDAADFARLRQIAQKSLEANILVLSSGKYLRAGAHQFQALWTRDFSFSASALLSTGHSDVVRDHLSLILKHIRESDGLVPRYLDSKTTQQRYIELFFGITNPPKEPLRADYHGGGGRANQAVDSNALMLLAALDYVQHTGDWDWWNRELPQLVKVYRYYDHLKDASGLIVQPPFADWQDSAKRSGKTFFTNLLYYVATEHLALFPEFEIQVSELAGLKQRIIDTLWDPATGLYLSVAGHPYISLEANLLAITLGFHSPKSPEAMLLYDRLKMSPFWTRNPGIPGFGTYPDYPKSWQVRKIDITGMNHYHDQLYWSWLMGLSAKTAYLMGDLEGSNRMLQLLQQLAIRDNAVAEVFSPKPPFAKYHTWIYHSEAPFSWGSALVLDALNARQ